MSTRDRVVDLAVGAVALAIYLLTLAPTITWRNNGADSGDLVSAAFTLGIPHPTGYPLFTIIAAIFSHLPFGEPARNVNAFSALASAGAVVLISSAGRQLFPNSTLLARWIAPGFALVFAFAPALWSQATIAEVNALSIFLAATLLAVLFSDSPRRLFFAAAIFGIGLTHHLTILLLVPAAILLLTSTRWTRSQIVQSLFVLFAPLLLYLYLPLRASTHQPINWGNPETLDGFFWVVSGAPYRPYVFAVSPSDIFGRFALTARFLFEQFTVVGAALGLWGAMQMGARADALTQRRWLALLLAFALPVAYAVLYASRDSFVYLLPAFLVFVFWMMYGANDVVTRATSHPAGGAGSRLGSRDLRSATMHCTERTTLAHPARAGVAPVEKRSGGEVHVLRGAILSERSEPKGATKQSPFPVKRERDDARDSNPSPHRGEGRVRGNTLLSNHVLLSSMLFLGLFPLYNLVTNFSAMNLSSDFTAYDYAKKIFTDTPRQAVIIADGDEHLFSLQYYQYVITPQSESVVVSAELLQYSWYFDQVRRMLPSVNASPITQPDRLVAVIDASLAQRRSIYVTAQNDWFSQYAVKRQDGYYRVIGRLP